MKNHKIDLPYSVQAVILFLSSNNVLMSMEKRLFFFLLTNTCYVLLQVVTGVKFFEILSSFSRLFVMLNQTKHIGQRFLFIRGQSEGLGLLTQLILSGTAEGYFHMSREWSNKYNFTKDNCNKKKRHTRTRDIMERH